MRREVRARAFQSSGERPARSLLMKAITHILRTASRGWLSRVARAATGDDG